MVIIINVPLANKLIFTRVAIGCTTILISQNKTVRVKYAKGVAPEPAIYSLASN